MDLRLTDAQLALREEAAAFAASLRPTLADDPEWRRQGMLSDGDSREVTRALGEAGWIGMTWPRGARRARAHPRRRRARRGGLRLPLAPALALPALVQDDRLRARALRLARAEGAAPRPDRARRAHVLPGLLRAGGGERPRVADDPRRAPRRPLRRRRPQDLDVERVARRLDLPRRAHEPGRAAAPRDLRPRRADRHTRDRGARASRRSAAATSARSSSTASRSRSRTSSARSTAAGTC